MSGAIAFGYLFDRGEIAVPAGRLSPRAGEILYQAGFWRQVPEFGGWHQSLRLEHEEQVRNIARVIDQLLGAGFEVRNWHTPSQGGADLVRHYAWLQDTGPFPNADAHTAAAHSLAVRALASRRLREPDRPTAEEVAQGLLAVEARHDFGDGIEWWLARRTDQTGVYVMLRHDTTTGGLNITDEYADWYAGAARRNFRVSFLRDTTTPPPLSARALAARGSRAARMSAAPSTVPFAPGRATPIPASARR
ncbi:hypothetical protein [Kitasatospora sp. GAS1066B]|uniref:hypothetical protein n=1 Tax=Kitasatospora sp. GAS1066B TaxID=3156271 RepID=UPI003516E1C9